MADNYYSGESEGHKDIEEPLLTTGQLGTTIAEGQNVGNKNFIQTLQAAIHEGASKVELSLGAGMSEGVDSYSMEKLHELREMAKASEVELVSVHTPVSQVVNLSGYDQRKSEFSDQMQQMQLDEVKKAIRFAAETTNGSAIVVHTGEFPRPISQYKGFESYKGARNKENYFIVFEDFNSIIPIVSIGKLIP